MKLRHLALFLTTLAWVAPTLADPPGHYRRSNAHHNQLMVRAALADLPGLSEQYGFRTVGELTSGDGPLAILEGPESMTTDQMVELIAGDPRVEELEPARLAALPRTDASGVGPIAGDVDLDRLRSGSLATPCLNQLGPSELWSGFADQEAARLVRIHPAHAEQGDCGSATVAIIDTGVDPSHPVLSSALVSGYDFRLDVPGIPSEWDLLDQSLQRALGHSERSQQSAESTQSFQPILEQFNQPILEATLAGEAQTLSLGGSMVVLLDQESATELAEMQLPTHFGHGTMVAGIVRLVAPGARIMPLRVFNGEGSAHVFDIIRAIYYAVDHGADVINMSFSMEQSSIALRRAIRYARLNGVVCVAAVGNSGEEAAVYPALLPNTLGVAATTLDDELSEFSNYGWPIVDVAAPGAGVVTTFPSGIFAAGWGTSFSAPFVAGTAALIRDPEARDRLGTVLRLGRHIRRGSTPIPDLGWDIGSGRLDVLGAVEEADR